MRAADYPYQGVKNPQCNLDAPRQTAELESFETIKRYEASAWTAATNRGPIITFIDGSNPIFLGYTSGIINNPACAKVLNHIVNVVGWGISSSKAFWIIRN